MVEMINDFEKANPDIGVREHFKDGTTMVSEIHAAHSLHPPGDESLALAVAEQANKAGRSAAMRRRNWKLASRDGCDIRRASPRF